MDCGRRELLNSHCPIMLHHLRRVSLARRIQASDAEPGTRELKLNTEWRRVWWISDAPLALRPVPPDRAHVFGVSASLKQHSLAPCATQATSSTATLCP